MERTISGMVGKGSINHNSRSFMTSNVDKERTKDNIAYCNRNLKQIYHELFDEALKSYNAKQTRSDRKIDNYYEKIRTGKQEKLFHEVIFQIGNKDDMNVQSENGQLAKDILDEFARGFIERNSNLKVFSAHLHMDEGTPHLHIDFVPFISNSKRGLDTRVSLKGALGEQGFKGGTRGNTEWNQWIEAEKQELAKVMEWYGVKWKQLGTHNKHLSVLDYEKQERTKEVASLERIAQDKEAELEKTIIDKIRMESRADNIKAESEVIKQENEILSAKNDTLKEDNSGLIRKNARLLSNNLELEEKQQEVKQEIEQMLNTKVAIQRNVRVYDESAEWQLPEPTTFMTVKAYRDNKVLPLVEKLKELVKSLTIQCVNLMERVKTLTAKVTGQEERIGKLTEKLMEQRDEIDRLQEKAHDLERVKRFVGNDKINSVISSAKEIEKIGRIEKYR